MVVISYIPCKQAEWFAVSGLPEGMICVGMHRRANGNVDGVDGAEAWEERARKLGYVRSKSPLATENLLENTDGVLRPPRDGGRGEGGSEHPISVLSGWQPATSIYADGRTSDDVTTF